MENVLKGVYLFTNLMMWLIKKTNTKQVKKQQVRKKNKPGVGKD